MSRKNGLMTVGCFCESKESQNIKGDKLWRIKASTRQSVMHIPVKLHACPGGTARYPAQNGTISTIAV